MTRWSSPEDSWSGIFNTPLECGLRSVVLLAEAFPHQFDLQRLVHYDYLLVHSGDVEGGPQSIHPATPHRSGELMVRRPLIEKGIILMMSKSIIECAFTESGIYYFAGEWAVTFLESLKSPYIFRLKQSSKWVISRFANLDDGALTLFIRQNWNLWGTEFELEALVRESEG